MSRSGLSAWTDLCHHMRIAAGARVGAVELWDALTARVGGDVAPFVLCCCGQGGRSRATALRMVLRGAAQSRRQAANPRGYDVFCPSLALGRGPVAWHAPRPGSRCDGIGRAVCRVDRQCRLSRRALPVAWTVLPPTSPCVAPRMAADAGRCARHPAAGRGWCWPTGLVGALALPRIVRLGWHPLLRTRGGHVPPAGQARWYWLRELVGSVGQRWRGRGTALSAERRLACTLVAWGEEGYTEAWFC